MDHTVHFDESFNCTRTKSPFKERFRSRIPPMKMSRPPSYKRRHRKMTIVKSQSDHAIWVA